MGRGKAAAAGAPASGTARAGLVVGSHGRHCLVETPDGERRICHPRGKKSQAVVGDRVQWQPTADEGTIERVDERRNLFYRQDEIRTKSFAANLDQILLLVAAEPDFSEHQLTRALIAAEAQHIRALIVLNKSDLAELFGRAWERLAPYRRMGYAVLPLSLEGADAPGLAAVEAELAGRTTLILGPSGVGKSTLVNRLVPGALAQTGEISQALNSGRHTTTTTTWYWMDKAAGTALIDSPGFQEFGLNHIEPTQLPALMPDIAAHTGECRFYNCTHRHEPGCGVIAHVEGAAPPSDADISAMRYRIYNELFDELSRPPSY
ncbi:ribosome small subunit-dependent GTPase A [Pseudacidovorax intermedius]|uniref:Small ribosomal subunit biogenesis GTPase RsgA n=1 Tax=Pseudacidovorax intermedius TaxID=433924 RepID=A0A147HCJ9_9BURK|nr:ribosome small subunit-dependent GTPase A [Pseudacidovorax intermedius]KTT27872.1 GTPase RsgA [Pseudacidovorax intermedius]